MTLDPETESLILRGRRIVGEKNGDAYFEFIADQIRRGNDRNIFGVVRTAIAMFGPGRSKCDGCQLNSRDTGEVWDGHARLTARQPGGSPTRSPYGINSTGCRDAHQFTNTT